VGCCLIKTQNPDTKSDSTHSTNGSEDSRGNSVLGTYTQPNDARRSISHACTLPVRLD